MSEGRDRQESGNPLGTSDESTTLHVGIDLMEPQPFEEIKTKIRILRALGNFEEAAGFIQNLPAEVRLKRSIAIEIAQLYLFQGQLRLAAEICDPVSMFHDVTDGEFPTSCFEVEAAAFELLRAYIRIQRYSKLKTAVKIAQRVGSAWRLDVESRDGQMNADGEATGRRQDGISVDAQSLKTGGAQRGDDDLNEYRILLEFYYWKILVAAAEQGMLDKKATKAAAEKRISTLRRTVQSAGRLREARFLIYFEADMIESADDSLREFQEFAKTLNDPKWVIERALTMVDIGQRQLNSASDAVVASAEESLTEAERLFQQTNHSFGQIDVDFARISANNTISAGEKFILTTEIADRYFEIGHFQNGIRRLAFGVSPDMILDLYADHVARALELLDRKIEEAGNEIARQLSLLHSVSQASLKAPEYGFALQSLESYYDNVPEEIGPTNHSALAHTLAVVYASFGDHRKALEAAEESFRIANSGVSYEVISDAATRVGLMRKDHAGLYRDNSPEKEKWAMSAMDMLKEWADKDSKNGYVDGEVQKCLMIAELENARAMQHPESATGPIEKPWIDRVKQHIPDSADILKRDQIVGIEMRMLIRQKKYSASLEMSSTYLEELNKMSSVHPFTKGQAFFRSSLQAAICSSAALAALQEDQSPCTDTYRSAMQLLWSALNLAAKALDLYRQTNGTEVTLECTAFVWYLLGRLVGNMEESSRKELLEAFVDELHKTEKVCDEMRRSVVPISGLKSLMNKRLLVSKEASLKLYDIGLNVALWLNDPASAWEWLQKGRARAFADSLGVNVFIPKALRDKINSDAAARDLLKQEENILEALQEPGTNFVISARKLVSVRKKISENTLLAQIMKSRDGMLNFDLSTEDLNAALDIAALTPEMVKFVDWYVPSNGQIKIFVRQLNGQTTVAELSVTTKEVKEWVKRTFEYPEMSDPPLSKKSGNRLLQRMNVLIEVLSTMVQVNDLVVLSPSGVLNSVPLHALFVDGKPLIERNLVVYSSSTAVLRQCLARVNPASVSELESKTKTGDMTKFFAVYEEPFQDAERNLIFSHIRELASKFTGSVSLGPEVTKSTFLKECANAKWVHYHGHARYSKDDVLKSSLILSNGKGIFKDNIDDARFGRDELSVSELFNAELLRHGSHFTVIACDSGTQDIAPGDEPLGIIPALLYAGATSILGCQWPIDSCAGRAFSDAFYKELNLHGASNSVLYVAKALQNAVRKMRRGDIGAPYRQSYYWAPFALHGLWFFPN